MKKILILIAVIALALPVCAFEIPAGKKINREAVANGIETYSQKISENKDLETSLINRAFLYFLSDNLKSAISDYDKLIQINPNNEEFYLNRGYLRHLSNDRVSAIDDYKMALKIKPNYAFAFNNIGVALDELGRKEESLKAYDIAIQIDPNYADAYYNRGNLKTKNNKNEEALEDFNTAIQLNPKDSASFNNRGVVKRKLNYNVGALSDFSIAIKLNPEDITALANRGRLKKRYYDSEGAEEDFKTAISIAEESPILVKQIEIENTLAEIQRKQNVQKPQLKESKVNNDGIQKIAYNSYSADRENNIKTTSLRTGVMKVEPKTIKSSELPVVERKNEPKIETKPVTNPKLAECYYIRALQKYILQNRESAMKDFDMAIQHNPNYAEAYYYRAAIKRDLNDNGFVDDYKKAIQLNPGLKNLADADVLMILKI